MSDEYISADFPLDGEDLTGTADSLLIEHQEIQEAIGILEEVLPDVEDPLGIFIALFDLYNELENMDEAGACLMEAARRVSLGEHTELTYFLHNHLELYAHLHADVQEVYERLSQQISHGQGELGENTLHLDQRKIYQADLIPELMLAKHLHRFRVISDEECMLVLQGLCVCENREPDMPRCVLSLMEELELPHLIPAIEYLAEDAQMPYIDLNLMDPDPEILERLSKDFYRYRGALAVAAVGGEALVAMLNPYNLQLKEDVSLLIGSEVHFTLCSASGYRALLNLYVGEGGF